MAYNLIIGSKNYSSWSLRPWLALRVAGIPFTEELILLGQDDTVARILVHSPAGKVPILKTPDAVIWDSLAIIEEIASRHPEAGLWPIDPAARALARSISAEMHSGFLPLRRQLAMHLQRDVKPREIDAEAEANITRIIDIWRDARARFGAGGPFLFGAFTAADAMYAPVVWRFHTYAVEVPPEIRTYMDAMMALPAMQDWLAAAVREPRVARYEVD